MHFLLANDDGSQAIGLRALSQAILERGHSVVVCAPQTQQSAVSHHITLFAPLMMREVPWEGDNAKAYSVAGTPADCVRIAQMLTDKPFDFAFSGINNGENAGTAVYYSGTVSAAREARMLNIPAMAVSIMPHADEAMRLQPGLNRDAIVAAAYCPWDGEVNPYMTTFAYADRAAELGDTVDIDFDGYLDGEGSIMTVDFFSVSSGCIGDCIGCECNAGKSDSHGKFGQKH